MTAFLCGPVAARAPVLAWQWQRKEKPRCCLLLQCYTARRLEFRARDAAFIFWLVLVSYRPLAFLKTSTTSPKPPSTDEDVYEPKSRRPAGRLAAAHQRCGAAAAAHWAERRTSRSPGNAARRRYKLRTSCAPTTGKDVGAAPEQHGSGGHGAAGLVHGDAARHQNDAEERQQAAARKSQKAAEVERCPCIRSLAKGRQASVQIGRIVGSRPQTRPPLADRTSPGKAR